MNTIIVVVLLLANFATAPIPEVTALEIPVVYRSGDTAEITSGAIRLLLVDEEIAYGIFPSGYCSGDGRLVPELNGRCSILIPLLEDIGLVSISHTEDSDTHTIEFVTPDWICEVTAETWKGLSDDTLLQCEPNAS